MSSLRNPSEEERQLLASLLQNLTAQTHLLETLSDLLVSPMSDGSMGSLYLMPKGVTKVNRTFGRELVSGEFRDSDGTNVSVTVNVDGEGELYEMDFWKVDFTPLVSWPKPEEVTVTKS